MKLSAKYLADRVNNFERMELPRALLTTLNSLSTEQNKCKSLNAQIEDVRMSPLCIL